MDWETGVDSLAWSLAGLVGDQGCGTWAFFSAFEAATLLKRTDREMRRHFDLNMVTGVVCYNMLVRLFLIPIKTREGLREMKVFYINIRHSLCTASTHTEQKLTKAFVIHTGRYVIIGTIKPSLRWTYQVLAEIQDFLEQELLFPLWMAKELHYIKSILQLASYSAIHMHTNGAFKWGCVSRVPEKRSDERPPLVVFTTS